MDALAELADRWRNEADTFRSYGAERLATACEKHADELEAAWAEWWTERLTYEEAAGELGCTYSAIQKKVQRGDLPTVTDGGPRVRRCDLFPELADESVELTTEDGDPDLAGEVLRARVST